MHMRVLIRGKKNEYHRFWEAQMIRQKDTSLDISQATWICRVSFVNFYTCSCLFIRVYRVSKNECRPSKGRESDFTVYIRPLQRLLVD